MENIIKSFEDLRVWQEAHKLMLETYDFVDKHMPENEKYGRNSQMKRSASSAPSNIAEGFGRFHYLENIQFCRNARGSLEELKNHYIAARDLKQAPVESCESKIKRCEEVKFIINKYIKSTRTLYNQSK